MARRKRATAMAALALAAGAATAKAQPDDAPLAPTISLDPALDREDALARQLARERRVAGAERRGLIRKVRSVRVNLAELAEPLGKRPRFPWRAHPTGLEREALLARQLYRERHDRAEARFWLASNLRANSRLASLVRNPTRAGNRELAAAYFGWEFACADKIIMGESSYDHLVWNRQGSGAYGIGQARPREKMLAYGADAYTNPLTQLRWFRGYAEGRYGSVCAAAAHWNAVVSW